MTTEAVAAAVTNSRLWRLGNRTRKAVLVAHIASAGAWIGIDVVMGVFVFTALLTENLQTRALCYQALELFAVWPMITTGLVCLASGALLGLGTKYGLFRFWWVTVKFFLNLLLTSLAVLSLRPGVAVLADAGRKVAAGEPDPVGLNDLIYPPIVSPTLLLFAVILSLYKPWGRTRRRRS